MKLYEEGKLDLEKTLGDYLTIVKGTNKENLKIRNVLLHQAGLVAWIPFFEETIDRQGVPKPSIYSTTPSDSFSIRVAENMYMNNNWKDTLFQRILKSKVGPEKYEYSDLDFIFLGKIIEAITGQPLEEYVKHTFYEPLEMTTTTFKPRQYFPLDQIVPTATEIGFRQQLLRGDVHDPGAAMLGGVAGHAGLFSNAYDLAKLYQMLLNGGEMNGIRFLQKSTIGMFTTYSSNISRRALGFDKPEKDNRTRSIPYPAASAPLTSFGHTGFTGICVWADPTNNLVYIFLSNRVAADKGDNNTLQKMKVRASIQDVIYKAMKPVKGAAITKE
jgi:CubicO group peptidase (beta-lactamase class C family)